MSDWVDVAEFADLTRRRKKLVTVGDTRIALFHDAGEVYAFADACVHKGKALSRGTVLNGRLICPGHQWAFDLRTGRADDRDECQPGYPVRVEAGRVLVYAANSASLTAAAAALPVQE
ncbi:Rieske (2Fe-2S) protein [Streptomyces endophyticus]|uniref:Rieske 2Fe-2S domain-containing protein n=1 Tax=Streptomyces endophyticus TaxID=714166 RepID=A0ABU6FES8_9ACTN|nr:Rieske 2Fe-2S domain-containing protein [Streptomyces endophyticus]MEB8342494.1 Rieske 2Fe-2S domain-containing protein [Streptomyces endophyticus]